jgi:hypothetical protein
VGVLVEGVEEFCGIDGLDAVEELDGEFSFIGLEVTDEFPVEWWGGDGLEFGEVFFFCGGFLDFIFGDGGEIELGDVLDDFGGLVFSYGEDFDVSRVASDAVANCRNFILEGFEIFFKY